MVRGVDLIGEVLIVSVSINALKIYENLVMIVKIVENQLIT